jgi:hypothetical protein
MGVIWILSPQQSKGLESASDGARYRPAHRNVDESGRGRFPKKLLLPLRNGKEDKRLGKLSFLISIRWLQATDPCPVPLLLSHPTYPGRPNWLTGGV